jgi:hypothetical protein
MREPGIDMRPWTDGPIVKVVDYERVRQSFYERYVAEGDAEARQSIRRQALHRAAKDARAAGLIGTREINGTQCI